MKILRSTKSRCVLFAVMLLFIITAAGAYFTSYLTGMATRTVKKDVENANLIISLNLINELKRIEGAAVAVAGSPLTLPVLLSKTPENIDKAHNILDRYHKSLDAAACYLIDKSGITITSSNRNAKDSFVGQNYTFRSYFQQAIKGGVGRYFAFGTVSKKRGFFASAPVKNKEGSIVGVVAIKKELDDIETRLSQYIWFLVESNGIIFLSSLPEARLKSLWPLDNETNKQIVSSKQFGPGPFDSVLPKKITAGAEVTFKGKKYLAAQQKTPYEGVSVILLWPMQEVSMYRSFGMALTILSDLIAISFLLAIYIFRRSLREREYAAQDLKSYADQLKTGAELKAQISRISTELQKAETLEDLAQAFMYHLVPLTGVSYGAFYVMDEQERVLKLVGGYGLIEGKDEAIRFAVGQGLVGQCAHEKAPIDVTDPQKSPIRITWGGGHLYPLEILLLPVLQLKRILGVIELATLKPFTSEQRTLLEELVPMVALNIEILQRNIKTKDLLEQSRAQAAALVTSEQQLLARQSELEEQKALLISQRRELEEGKETLEKTEERSRLILGSISEGIYGLDRDGRTTFVNSAAATMLGYAEEELIGQFMHAKVHHTYPDGADFPYEACSICRTGQDGLHRTVDNEVLWRKDGSAVQVEYSTTPVRNNAQVVGTVVSFRDITDRKRMEKDLKQHMEEMERFSALTIDREEKMIVLKGEINDLLIQMGKGEKYKIVE